MTLPPSTPLTPATLVAIALGSNLGDRAANISRAFDLLATLRGTTLVKRSTVVETPALRTSAAHPGGPFLNAVALIETNLAPLELLAKLHGLEASLGRDRAGSPTGSPRTIDLDVIVFGRCVMNEPGLTIPHPRLHERTFVLGPLAEVAPTMVIPTLGRSAEDLFALLRTLSA